ncbi:MAG TPA: 23S rRNA pseudouridine(1911/1915/1917) synthase RluD [Burkholderiales bacterium]|nr:23S rRNA pseudouridine(1911/1915/1917) synthase RluD [Burkholderiales bacterium]
MNYTVRHDEPGIRQLVVPAECAGLRLDQALARLLTEHSRSRLQQWIRAGHVRVEGRAVTAKSKVRGGETIRIAVQPEPAAQAFVPEDMGLRIVYEDAAILVIDKPAGLVVHPGSGNWRGTLLNALLGYAPQLAQLPRAGIVHRLDKDTSGLLVVAKTVSARTALVRQLQARSVGREYLALVHGELARPGVVDAPIGRHPTARTRMAVVARGKPATTHYWPVEHHPGWSLVRCRLDTGRTHQIRVHLSSIGHPLIGDSVYRARRSGAAPTAAAIGFARQALHAARLRLLHPERGQMLEWESPLPPDLEQLLQQLRHGRPVAA